MKKRMLLFTLIAVLSYLTITSYSSGPALNGQNCSGAQGATTSCTNGSCHGGLSPNVSVAIELDSGIYQVSHYVAGITYTVKITGSNPINLYTRYGFQFASVSGIGPSQVQAGTTSAYPANVTTHFFNNINFVEHSAALTTGTPGSYTISFSWTAPAAGTGTVRMYCSLNTVNGNGLADISDVNGNTNVALTELFAPCTAPTGLAATSVTTTTANLSWNSVAGALNYEYIVDQNPATPAVPGTITTNTFYNATGLSPGTTYYLHVRANCANPNYSSWITSSFTTLTPCPNPSGLAAASITTTTANLSWNSVVGALNYEYIVDQSPATPAGPGTITTNTFYNATGLTPSTTYYLHVRANCANPNYSAWVTASFITLTPCANPTGLTAAGVTTTTANLSWNSVVAALNYEYIVDQSPATPAGPGTVTTNIFYNATGLTPSTTYYLHVRANCGNPNYSGWVTASFITLTPCPNPSGLTATGITTTTANLSWGSVTGALNYEYIVDQNPATPAVPGTVTTNTFYNATSLTPTTTYYLHVRANCGNPNYSAWVTASFITLTPCPNPAGLTAAGISPTTANLSWNSVVGAVNYEYIVDQSPATPAVPGTVTTNTFYNATSLTPGTTYYLHVRANCGNPNYSAWVTASFTTLIFCNTPVSLAATGITTTSANLSWGTVAGVLNYEYIVDQNPATPAIPGTVTTNAFYNATGLTPTTTYYLHVRANCGNPNYSAWATASFTTLTPCSNPAGLAAANVTSTTANLSWNSVVAAINYEYIVDQSPATPAVPGTVTTNTFYNATALTPATTYYLHVRANCGNPNYSAWVTTSFTTLIFCASPAGIAANNITTSSADLSWNTVAAALNYEYIVDQSPLTPAVPGTATTNTTYSAVALAQGTTYYLHLRSYCGPNNYSAWAILPFTTLSPCPSPTGLAAANITTTTADLSWGAVVGSQNYEYIVDQSPFAPVVSGTITNNTTYNATSLSAGTTYYLHVRANCANPSYSAWVTISFSTVPQCADPSGLSASLVTDVSALLSWDPITGATYQYTIDQNAAAPAAPGTPTNNTNYSATGLSPAATYYLHVRSDCGANNLSNWITLPFTTFGIPASMLVGWNVAGLTAYGPSPLTPTTPPPAQVLTSGLQRSANVTIPALQAQATNNAWGGMQFYGSGGPYVPNLKQDLIDNNSFLYFTVKSTPGYTVSLSSFDMYFGRYGIASPQNAIVQYGLDSAGFADLAIATHTGTPANPFYYYPTIDLTGIAALQNVTSGHTIYFRILPVYSANDSGTAAWYVYNGNTDPLFYQGADLFLKGSYDVALPLDLVSFTGMAAINKDDGNLLTWITANEQNIKGFELQRSYDAQNFTSITKLTAKGNGPSQSAYSYYDKENTATHTFYRLKVNENNGSYKYSKVIDINSTSTGHEPEVYPNPVHDRLLVNLHGNSADYRMKVTDMLGREMKLPLAFTQPGSLSIDVSSLALGVYVLHITGGQLDNPRSISFSKQ